jgi:hypothetical protein
MKLFVPELGTEIVLSSDWNFTLFEEYRNSSLIEVLEARKQPHRMEAQKILDASCKELKKVLDERPSLGRYSDWGGGYYGIQTYFVFEDWKSELAVYWKDRLEVEDAATKSMDACLVSGTKLKIERIYIRKGSSEYSSLTFRIIDSPDELLRGKKKLRFWAKLEDCNNIEFDFA